VHNTALLRAEPKHLWVLEALAFPLLILEFEELLMISLSAASQLN